MGSPSRRDVLAAMLAAPAAMSAGRGHAQTPMTLKASYSTSAFDKLMAQAGALYARRGTTIVEFLRPTPENHDAHLKQTLLRAVTGGLPDVSFQANNHVARLVRSTIAQPLDAFANSDPDWSAVGTSAVGRIGRVNGIVYGIPFQISVPICMVNLDLAARAGVAPDAIPQDWPGLLSLAKQITALGSRLVGGFFDFGAAWTFQALVTAQGGRMATPDGRKVAFDGAEGLAALQVVRGFGEAGMVDMTQSQALQAFGAGMIGVLATSNNVLAGLEQQAGDRFRIGTVPWPLTSPEGRVPAGGRTGVIFTRDAARQAAAWDFLRFMSSPEVQTLVVKATGAIPVDPDAVEAPERLGRFYAEHPNHRAGLARSRQLTGWYSYPGDNTAEITDVMIEHLRSVAARTVAPEPALEAMRRDVQALLPATL